MCFVRICFFSSVLERYSSLSSFYPGDTMPRQRPIDTKRLRCNNPRPLRPGEIGYGEKKQVVLGCENGQQKLIKFGAVGYKHNYSARANENFRARMRCDKDPASKLEARYWACETLWPERKK